MNSTGAYELDLTLVDDFSAAWRTMHIQSDVFCSASITLPDKAGRQLNVGGWSLQSTQGVRLYLPDGSAGVNGTNDWEENFDEIHLQRQRWYPSVFSFLRAVRFHADNFFRSCCDAAQRDGHGYRWRNGKQCVA